MPGTNLLSWRSKAGSWDKSLDLGLKLRLHLGLQLQLLSLGIVLVRLGSCHLCLLLSIGLQAQLGSGGCC